jgi:MFS family permease
VGLFQLNIVIGILIAYLSNFLIAQMFTGDVVWRLKLGVAVLPSMVLMAVLFRIPHSPRWLLVQGRRDEALVAASRLRMGNAQELIGQTKSGSSQASERLNWSAHARAVVLALALASFNQLSGINAIIYYLNDIFQAAGFNSVSADIQAVAIGFANLVATMLGLALIDRVGRKPLLRVGAVGTCIALSMVALIYSLGAGQVFLLPALLMFILFFGISQGAVIWVYLAELFPTEVRARGQALGSATHWLLNAALSYAFPIVAATTLSLPFWFFAGMMALQYWVVTGYFPETKGVALEDMQATLSSGSATPGSKVKKRAGPSFWQRHK